MSVTMLFSLSSRIIDVFFSFWVWDFVSYLIHSGEDHRERRDSCLCIGVHNHILHGLGRKRPVFVGLFLVSVKSSGPT